MSDPAYPEELQEALEKIAPELEGLAREAEIERRAPEALAPLLKRARIPMAKVPRELGGFELSPAEQVDFFARIAYLNPSAGWLAFNQCGAAGLVGAALPEAGLSTLFAHDSPLLAAVAAPTGRSKATDGGYRVSGRWSYASGVHLAEWVLLMTLCDKPPGPRGVLLPRSSVELHDNWHVAALQGTGSVDVSVDDAFVPEELTLSPLVQQRGGAQYLKLGFRGYVAGENVGFSLGVAQRLVDEISRLASTKKRTLSPDPIGERGPLQMELARTDATLRAARAYVQTELARGMEQAEERDAPIELSEAARLAAAVAWATESMCQAAMRLFPYAGAGALHLDNWIQRSFRDLVGSGQHVVASNEALEEWGRALVAAAASST